ncbi:MAG: pentapeptide repeat-containing protein [Actinobacteria bacterium]|nr:pentapeptide repeat-containing protein [Actinomycetota bacterium]
MHQQHEPDWTTCQAEDGCSGVHLENAHDQGCVFHTEDDDARKRWWHKLGRGEPLDARGLTFTSEQLDQLLKRAPQDDQDSPRITEPDFRAATFQGEARFVRATFQGGAGFAGATFTGFAGFNWATFQGDAEFDGATFEGGAGFVEATFEGGAEFAAATFEGGAEFDGATFTGRAKFGEATFQGHAGFAGATFTGDAEFDWATFEGAGFDWATFQGDAGFVRATFQGGAGFAGATFTEFARFDWATFQRGAEFDGATFKGDAGFNSATFQGDAGFGEATFQGGAGFAAATFGRSAYFGPMLAAESVDLTGATFPARLDLQAATPVLQLRRARILGGGHLRVGWAHIDLTEAEIVEPCILEDAAHLLRDQNHLWERFAWHLEPERDDEAESQTPPSNNSQPLPQALTWTSSLESLQRATVTGLVLGAIDLTACRFAGAHDLDQLRVPHAAELERPPSRLFASRRVLAEEIVWRQREWKRRDWPVNRSWQRLKLDPFKVQGAAIENGESPSPSEIAELYRALRTGREARGDEPGAADFYYGEMEMRRHSSLTPRWERVILFFYWALSGYALRASRALFALAMVIVVGWATLGLFGYQDPSLTSRETLSGRAGPYEVVLEAAEPTKPGWNDAFWASLESVVFRGPQQGALTTPGRITVNLLRFFGPVLLAFAVLSVRGRVKR